MNNPYLCVNARVKTNEGITYKVAVDIDIAPLDPETINLRFVHDAIRDMCDGCRVIRFTWGIKNNVEKKVPLQGRYNEETKRVDTLCEFTVERYE